MFPSAHIRVVVDLARVHRNALDVANRAGVPLIAVVKADAYGLGAAAVARVLAEVVEGFCVFSPQESAVAGLLDFRKPVIAIGPPLSTNADDYVSAGVRPAVANAAQAATLNKARPVLCVDTGQQRFACPINDVPAVLAAGGCDEAFTHAANLAQVEAFCSAVPPAIRRHAAGSSLLDEPRARLDAVRPGLALYRGAVRVTTLLVEVRKTAGPAGYTRFSAEHHGIILAGYSNGLRPGPCLVNGRPSRLLEVGMQSAFVETTANDRIGDEVVLLGDALTEQDVARASNTTPHEALVRLSGCGTRTYAR